MARTPVSGTVFVPHVPGMTPDAAEERARASVREDGAEPGHLVAALPPDELAPDGGRWAFVFHLEGRHVDGGLPPR
jgi:hypothetical protein